MRPIRTLALLVAVVALAVVASPAPAAAKANKEHAIHGVVQSIDVGGKTFTVKTGGHKNKKTGETTPVVEKTFKVTDATTFVKTTGEKGAETTTTLKFDEIKEKMHVAVTANGDVAVEVKVGHHHHGKKKPAA